MRAQLVLAQYLLKNNKEVRVISYASKNLSEVEKGNSQTEKEALAVVWVCNCFYVYLYCVQH